MNYFDFYDMPVGFNPDLKKVKQQFYALSKKYHPDFYIGQSQEKQDEALELSTLNNRAYQVLSNQQKLVPYVLELKGQLPDDENYSLPQSFLMEMMELNEAIMDLQLDVDKGKKASLLAQINTIDNSLSEQMQQQIQVFDQSGTAETLKAIKELYFRNKYLQRIRESLDKL